MNTLEEIRNVVSIDMEDYEYLIEAAQRFEILRNALYLGASLGYNNRSLRFDNESVSAVLRAIDNGTYEVTLDDLKKGAIEQYERNE